jgi:hypothetical protein
MTRKKRDFYRDPVWASHSPRHQPESIVLDTEYLFLLEMKQGYSVCPVSWSVHCNFTGDGKCNERGWACTPPPSPAMANFTLMTVCTPERSGCYSVYSVVLDTHDTQKRGH